jgi:hypothetical protein
LTMTLQISTRKISPFKNIVAERLERSGVPMAHLKFTVDYISFKFIM